MRPGGLDNAANRHVGKCSDLSSPPPPIGGSDLLTGFSYSLQV